MVNMTKFHEILLDAINLANKKIRNRISGEIVGNELQLEIRREKQGSYNCINSTLLSVHPSGSRLLTGNRQSFWTAGLREACGVSQQPVQVLFQKVSWGRLSLLCNGAFYVPAPTMGPFTPDLMF